MPFPVKTVDSQAGDEDIKSGVQISGIQRGLARRSAGAPGCVLLSIPEFNEHTVLPWQILTNFVAPLLNVGEVPGVRASTH